LGSFGYECFVGDVILGVDSGFFGLRHRSLGLNPRGNFFFFFLHLEKICIFRALDWLSSVCGWEVM